MIKVTQMDEDIKEIVVYGTAWCGQSRRAKQFLVQHEIPFKWIDIDLDAAARAYVEQINDGYRSVPTLIFPDGSILVEPSENELGEKFGIFLKAN
jgi:glutaredoxin